MINWTKGLTSLQEDRLAELLVEESKIPIEEHMFTCKSDTKVLTGRLLPKNRLVIERDIGYMYFVETSTDLVSLSVFDWTKT